MLYIKDEDRTAKSGGKRLPPAYLKFTGELARYRQACIEVAVWASWKEMNRLISGLKKRTVIHPVPQKRSGIGYFLFPDLLIAAGMGSVVKSLSVHVGGKVIHSSFFRILDLRESSFSVLSASAIDFTEGECSCPSL